jgi:unsaturated chondroitin disaccharide hydrolase
MTLPERWAEAHRRLVSRVVETRRLVGEAWPYHADPLTGRWETTADGDWCGGHWVECLRIAHAATGDAALLEEALARTEWLRPYLERDDQFRGHRFAYSAARLWQATGDPALRTLALAAAWAMRAMAIPSNGAMPIGTEVQVKSTTLASRAIVAVDNVHPNLMLDWFGWWTTGDPTFRLGAERHLAVTERDFIRPDGSTIEFIEYDTDTGVPKRHFTLLGRSDDSTWSRGQAWAIAGYLRAFEETGETRWLRLAKRLAAYWWGRTGEADPVPPWDFDDAERDAPRDTSAAAIVAEALARLAVQPDRAARARCMLPRLPALIDALIARLTPDGRLLQGCFNRPRRVAENAELIWGDAYLLMALELLRTGRVFR